MYTPKNTSAMIARLAPFKKPIFISLNNKAIFFLPDRFSSINTRIVTAKDCVPTFPAISSTRDWKQITIGNTATIDSNIPTTEDTAIPKNNNAINHGSLFFILTIVGSFKSSSSVKPASFA